MSKRSRIIRPIIVAVILLGVSVALAAYYRLSRRPKPVVLSGTVEAHSVSVGSLAGGRIASLSVSEGDRVERGSIVATLETDTLDKQIQEQWAAIAVARAEFLKAQKGPREEEIHKAELLYENAERERRRLQKLVSEGVIARQIYDDAVTAASTAATDLAELRKGTRSEDIAAARARLEREEARLATLAEQKSESIVAAPSAGFVQSIAVRPGDLVAPNQGIVEIIEQNQLWVRVYVPETLLGLVHLGARATVTIDTFPDRTYSGTVTQINQKGEYTPRNVQTRSQRAEQVFGIKVTLDPHPDLKPGMAADVDLGVRGRA